MIPLLPYEKYLISQLGITEEQYQKFKAYTAHQSITRPKEGPQAGPAIPILVNIAIGVGLSLLSALLFPPQQNRRGEIKVKQEGGQNLSNNQRASPRFGFNAIQEPAQVGQLTPVVIAKREGEYGGVRVNMPMIWSQLLSLKGSQMFRGIFLVGASAMPQDAWDMRGWAFGNNTLGAYAFFGPGDAEGGRFTIYYRRGGGRIQGSNKIAGRNANKDIGNAENDGGQDVYAIRLRSDNYETAFCMSEAPSTSTRFGLYGWCPNAMLYRASARIRPTIQARIGGGGNVRTDDDAAVLCDIWKAKWHWSMRAGLRAYNDGSGWVEPADTGFEIQGVTVEPGDRVRYRLGRTTDADTKFEFNEDNANIKDNKSKSVLRMTEVGAGVAGFQNSADNALIPGELYKIGTCWAVLENRNSVTNENDTLFISDQDNEPPGDGNTMTYVFIVVKSGRVQFVGPDFINPPETGNKIEPDQYDPDTDLALLLSGTENRYKVCSSAAQIFRLGIASVASVREVNVMEIGFKSRVGIRINNMTEFRSCPTIQEVNAQAGQNQVGDDAGSRLSVSVFTSNTLTTRAIRYSMFVVHYRDGSGDWDQFSQIFAIASNSSEDVYNYMRIEFADPARWEVRFEPITSWEIRRDEIDRVQVLDSTGTKERIFSSGGVSITTTGYRKNPLAKRNRLIQQLEPDKDIGLGYADEAYNSMIDGYGHFAEAFCYDNIQSTVDTSPEHEIVYVNYPSNLNKTPSYAGLATIGVNLLASLEFTNLQQFSGYCVNGYEMRQLLSNDVVSSTNLFPDWLREVMTSDKVGAYPPLPDSQIDRESFEQAAQWCKDRDYYYDKVESEPFNILQWASDTAQAHLLKLSRVGGVYSLKPAILFDEPMPIAALFTNGNILENSFSMETVDYLSRQPIIVQVKWREESLDTENPLFARERTATVQEAQVSDNSPYETLDLSSWCTNYKQAIDAACYLIRFRRLADHRIKFQTTPDLLQVALSSGSVFKMAIDVVNYDQAIQGVTLEDGTLVTTKPVDAAIAVGSYPALLWDGVSEEAFDGTFTINSEGEGAPAAHFFAIKSADTEVRTYEVSKIDISSEGVITVEAFHHPVDSSGVSLLGKTWTTYATGAGWTIRL
jgi:hypothetical protein